MTEQESAAVRIQRAVLRLAPLCQSSLELQMFLYFLKKAAYIFW